MIWDTECLSIVTLFQLSGDRASGQNDLKCYSWASRPDPGPELTIAALHGRNPRLRKGRTWLGETIENRTHSCMFENTKNIPEICAAVGYGDILNSKRELGSAADLASGEVCQRRENLACQQIACAVNFAWLWHVNVSQVKWLEGVWP